MMSVLGRAHHVGAPQLEDTQYFQPQARVAARDQVAFASQIEPLRDLLGRTCVAKAAGPLPFNRLISVTGPSLAEHVAPRYPWK